MTYTKNHAAWANTDPITAAAMNNLESQWTLMKALADAHNHDTRYYTKTLADITFFSTSYYTGFDADTIDGDHLADLVSSILPIGAIMIWSGSDGDVPDGWYVCDGNAHGGYTTPNLIERFVIGAGGAYAVDDSGGPVTWNGTITPTGSVAIGDHTLATAELPAHIHTYTEYYSPADGHTDGPYQTKYITVQTTSRSIGEQAAGGGTHGHTGSSASFTAIDPRPAYYSLYYVMKCE